MSENGAYHLQTYTDCSKMADQFTSVYCYNGALVKVLHIVYYFTYYLYGFVFNIAQRVKFNAALMKKFTQVLFTDNLKLSFY
jgi:hypothetical protein